MHTTKVSWNYDENFREIRFNLLAVMLATDTPRMVKITKCSIFIANKSGSNWARRLKSSLNDSIWCVVPSRKIWYSKKWHFFEFSISFFSDNYRICPELISKCPSQKISGHLFQGFAISWYFDCIFSQKLIFR